jgi:anti-sigma regulatory factor (Ser/Thr protein kinase)
VFVTRTTAFQEAAIHDDQLPNGESLACSEMPTTLDIELPHDPTAPGIARRAMEDFLTDRCTHEVAQTVVMAGSELVTNAIRHTSGSCRLTVRLIDSEVIVEVRDNDSTLTDRAYLGDDLIGRGLGMLQSISERWGIERHPDGGKVVWAEISTSALQEPTDEIC